MFISLRNHTTYSLCKGAIFIPDLVSNAKKFLMPALGLMDSQNLFGALEFSSACKKEGIQPILGCEMLVSFSEQEQLTKLPLIATNDEGYKNLLHLAGHSFLNRKTGITTHIDFDLLKQKSSGLIALSGGTGGV
ncbi:MAG: PHP domain-containing protein, partial [Alphaproteobacteria bacterium]|nr:PHP domain-containing protein [Alphaproteobacteria bacterium]